MDDDNKPNQKISDNLARLTEQMAQANALNETTELSSQLNNTLENKQLNLSSGQTEVLQDLVETLTGNTLSELEDRQEANKIAKETLDKLTGIENNTKAKKDVEPIEFAGGLIASLITLPAILSAGLLLGISDATKSYAKFLKKVPLVKYPVIGIEKSIKFLGKLSNSVLDDIKKLGSALKGLFKGGPIGRFIMSSKQVFAIFSAQAKGLLSFRNLATGQLRSFDKTLKSAKGLSKVAIGMAITMGKIANSVRAMNSGTFTPILESVKAVKSAFGAVEIPKFGNLGKIIEPITKTVKGIFKVFGSINKAFFAIGRVFGRLFAPLAVILAVVDTVKGAIAGFTSQEGGFVKKLVSGFVGGITGLFKGFIALPLDLLKNIISWVAGKLGFENFAKVLDGFSFAALFDKLGGAYNDALQFIIDTVVDFVKGIPETLKSGLDVMGSKLKSIGESIGTFVTKLASAGAAALRAIAPGGLSPLEAFSQAMATDKVPSGVEAKDLTTGSEISDASADNEMNKSQLMKDVSSPITVVNNQGDVNQKSTTTIGASRRQRRGFNNDTGLAHN